ncbi:hypothetical protein [Streptococcus sp. DD13]|uniref:hypothetical protein n=1 Tax=Streptococcus sp. DD13 TaxID=1777881 RepID=UPI000791F005|nr:hypothetical protein [Streptococcus sp. DD13]KXT77694.1 LtrC-like protein [Streptococcus sp. DD13]
MINSETNKPETVTYFKPVPVFDISQVKAQEGKELDLPKETSGIQKQLTKEVLDKS